MKHYFLKVLAGMVIGVLFSMQSIYAAEIITQTLEKDTRITPPRVMAIKRVEMPMFKKGTVVTLNEYGEVLEGILAEDINLPYETGTSRNSAATVSYTVPQYIFIPTVTEPQPQYRVLRFKDGTKVVFNDKGEVTRGTVCSDRSVMLTQSNHIWVSDGEIRFYKNGLIAICTLADDYYLRPVGWSQISTENNANIICTRLIEFKGKKPVELNEKCEVTKGTLSKDTKLMSPIGIMKVYEAGTTVEFDDNGSVVKASK